MEISKILLCILVAVVCVRGKEVDEDRENLKICRKEFRYPDSYYPSYNPIEKKEKCFVTCLMERDGMMKNGKISYPEMNHSSKNYSVDRQNERKKLLDCIDQANKEYDKCDVAASALKCFGLKHEFLSHKKD